MKIVVTGGAGFIASHVVDEYVNAGHSVVVIDNIPKGQRGHANKKTKLYNADLRDAEAIDKIFAKEKPDVVNHHAAFISVTASVKDPRKTYAINVMGTLNVLTALAAVKTATKKKFIFASTGGAIYGNAKHLPADENTTPDPLSPYALSKQMAEMIVRSQCGAYGMDYLIFRYANIYGPRQASGAGSGVFPTFASQMRAGITPTIFGNGKKTRDYVYVGDVARASLLGLTRGKNETINIATSMETSDYQVYKAIANALGFKKEPKYKAVRDGEVRRSMLDNKKAKRVLGWVPKMKFEEGVKAAVQSFR